MKAKLRQEERERRRKSHERALGGPEAYEQYTFERFDPNIDGVQPNRLLRERLLSACLKFNPTESNLFILGGQGRGKTHLSTAIARRVLDQGGRARVFRGNELAAALRGRRNYATEYDELDAIADLAEFNVIVIDDIEDGRNRDTYLSALKVLMDQRKNNRRFGMIVTSNKSIPELFECLGPKIRDRIEGEFNHLVIPDGLPSVRPILSGHKNNAKTHA